MTSNPIPVRSVVMLSPRMREMLNADYGYGTVTEIAESTIPSMGTLYLVEWEHDSKERNHIFRQGELTLVSEPAPIALPEDPGFSPMDAVLGFLAAYDAERYADQDADPNPYHDTYSEE